MAAFVIFNNSQEKTSDSYKELIQRLQREAKVEVIKNCIGAAILNAYRQNMFSCIFISFLATEPMSTMPGNKENKVEDIPHLARPSTYNCYFTHNESSRLHGIKDYIYHLSMKTFEGGAGILICENPTPTLKYFIRLIEQVKAPDGFKSNAYYYGEIKNIITGFMNYFTSVIDETAKKINKHTQLLTNKLFVELIDETTAIYEENHTSFLKYFPPLNSEIEKEKYQQVIEGQANFLKELRKIRDVWDVRQDNLDVFAKKTFEASIQKISDLCNFTHTYISVMLADRLYEIATSIEETATRLKSNLEKCKENNTNKKNMLIQNLYERNKERLEIYRRLHNRSIDTEDVKRTIELLREKIQNIGNEETLARLELESLFWNKRRSDFNDIASVLIRIKMELENLEADRKKYKSIKCLELPGTKTACFDLIGENFDDRISYLQKKQLQMSKAIITFFWVRGTNRVLYTDRAGSFYVDEFNHQNYISNYGLKYFHVNCYGEFVENSESTPYYFDDNGRYTLDENGEKIYQVAPCTSQYKLGEETLFKKITKDCGHSEKPNPDCRLEEIKDLSDKVILPRNVPIDMTETLDHESVKYLWENFGMFLPEVLYEVATKQPKNPIHAMAHSILKRKFEASAADLRNMRKNAAKYRHDIKKKQMDKAIEERRAWKAKLMTRRKPEHYDDYYERAAYQHAMDCQFVESMGYYD